MNQNSSHDQISYMPNNHHYPVRKILLFTLHKIRSRKYLLVLNCVCDDRDNFIKERDHREYQKSSKYDLGFEKFLTSS